MCYIIIALRNQAKISLEEAERGAEVEGRAQGRWKLSGEIKGRLSSSEVP